MAQRSSWASYAVWGAIAVCAVLASAVTIALVVGNHRGIQFASTAKRLIPTERPAAQENSASEAEPTVISMSDGKEIEIARLTDALRTLAAERDRLDERVKKLEQSLGDITASIRERPGPAMGPMVVRAPQPQIPVAETEARAAESAKSNQRIAAAPTQLIAPDIASHGVPPAGAIATTGGGEAFLPFVSGQPMIAPPSATQEPMQIHAIPLTTGSVPTPASGTPAPRTEFAVDLGSEPNVDALRARWTNLRGSHAPVLGALRPLVTIREGTRPGGVELRLIAGPLANAGDAARVCASLQAKGVNCRTAVFDGQRLAMR